MGRSREPAQQNATRRAGRRPANQPVHPVIVQSNPSLYAFPAAEQCFPGAVVDVEANAAPNLFGDIDAVSADYSPQVQVHRHDSIDGPFGSYGMHSHGLEKFPTLEGPGYSFMYNTAPAASPSIVSSHSSTISRGSSTRSTLSSIQTELVQLQQHNTDFLPGLLLGSRGPSPLRHVVSTLPSPTEASERTALPGEWEMFREASPSRSGSVDSRFQQPHPHVCLWGSDGPCESGGFATKEELNWHVKAEHLLLCPVLGCIEGTFADAALVRVHIDWAHKNATLEETKRPCQSSNLLRCSNLQQQQQQQQHHPPSQDSLKPAKLSAIRHEGTEERRLKLELTVATSKKKCRDQLKSVVDKKSKRQAAITPRSVESPGMVRSWTPRMIESIGFPIVWEHGVLPFLIELMPKWCGSGHVISVIRGKRRDSRRICIMTTKPISRARKVMIAAHVRDLLPEIYRSNLSFVFSVGEVERLTWARGLSKSMPDDICIPRNPFCYINPQMGDSIGMKLEDGDTTATLGPCIKIGDAAFWLANFHPFAEADLTGISPTIEHPSPEDRDRCLVENHDALERPDLDLQLGKLIATSGYDLNTTRVTHDPYWEDCDKEPPLIVTDWSLISSKSWQANMLRKFPTTATPHRDVPITRMSSVVPGVEVCSAGRTSGFQHGTVCEIPAYLDGKKNGTGKATREWFIEEPLEDDDENAWIRGGMGVPGDSGAAVVDCETNALIGQLWGRNKYYGAGPRFAFFSPVFDIFDDIQERCGEQTRPQLPQYRDDADRWPAYPICRPCFDLQEYLSSRRSSRESLVSMIPGSGLPGEKEHDVATISELATPKELVDQSYWIRHAGVEDIGSSFGSVVSPAPVVSTFFQNPHAASPRSTIIEIKSPYPVDINEDDVYDNTAEPLCNGLGKRHLGATSLMRSCSHQPGKRRRIM